jgi:AcrR family transcriptional regulator
MGKTRRVSPAEPERPRRRRLPGTRDRIADAALELFSTRGFEAATMRDLAARLDMTTAALYYHYQDKADILVGVVEPMLEDADRLVTLAKRTQPDINERLEGVVDLLLAHQRVFRLLSSDVSASSHPAIAERVDQHNHRLFRYLAPERGEASMVRAVAVFGLLARPIIALPQLDLADHRQTLLQAAASAYHAMDQQPGRANQRRRKVG